MHNILANVMFNSLCGGNSIHYKYIKRLPSQLQSVKCGRVHFNGAWPQAVKVSHEEQAQKTD